MIVTVRTDDQAQATLEHVATKVLEMLNPALSRRDIVAELQALDNLLNDDTDDDDDDDVDDAEKPDLLDLVSNAIADAEGLLKKENLTLAEAKEGLANIIGTLIK